MRTLKQSTARTIAVFLTDAADHVSGKPGLTPAVSASKGGAAFASIAPTVTELANGWYAVALTTAHTDTLGDLALHITATGADPTDLLCQVVAVDFADATGLGLANLDTNVGSRSTYAGGPVASVTGAVGSVGAAVTVGGYAAGQDPGTLVLATPARKIVTDSSGRVTALDSTGAAFAYAAPPASSVVAAAVWDQATAGHTTAGTFGAAASAAGSAGDPWATALPGGYSAGQAGYILGTNLDAKSSDTRARVLLALPAAAPGASNGLVILGTNAAGVTLQPAAGDALKLSAAGGYAINASGLTGSTVAATGLGSAALTCTPGTGGVGIASDIQGDLLGSANILYQTAVVTAATSTTVTLSSPVSGPPSTTPGAYVGGTFWVKTGTGSRQVRTVTAYDSVNRIVTVDRPWDTAPDATSIGQILLGQEYAANAAEAGDAMALAANAVTAASVAAGALDGKGDWNTVAPDNAGVAAIRAKTDALPASPAAVGSAMTLADGSIRESTITAPAEAAGQPAGILGMIRRIFERGANKRTRDGSTGVFALRDAADGANLETATQSTTGTVDSITKAQ